MKTYEIKNNDNDIKDIMKVINQKLKDNNLHDKPIKTKKDIDNILDVLFDDIDD